MAARLSDVEKQAYTVIVLVAVGLLIAGIGIWATESDGPGDDGCAATDLLEPPCGAWWGAYVPYAQDGPADGSLTRAVYAFERKIGRRLDLVYNYHDMSNTELDGQLLTPDERELGEDRLLMLAWESTIWREPHHENWTEDQRLGERRLREVRRGDHRSPGAAHQGVRRRDRQARLPLLRPGGRRPHQGRRGHAGGVRRRVPPSP